MDVVNPRVSVILPTYNRAQLIAQAIQSVLDQTYQDFELIIVDDGSKDETEEVVNSFDDERIRYARHEENKGANAARNTGIAMARGEYIAFQDSDDKWLPEKLERQMRIFLITSTDIGVVYTGCWRVEGTQKTYFPSPNIKQKEGNLHNQLLKGNLATTQTVVMKKECFNKVGLFDVLLPRLQDWELFIRVSKYYSFKYVDEALVISYLTPDSISTKQDALIFAHIYILKKHYADIEKSKVSLAYHYFNIGHFLCLSNGCDQGRTYLRKAFLSNPLNFKYLGAVVTSLLGKDFYCYVFLLSKRLKLTYRE